MSNAVPRLIALAAIVFAVSACGAAPPDEVAGDAEGAPLGQAQQEATCTTCGGAGGGTVLPLCAAVCSATADCATACRTASGEESSCGEVGQCRSCAAFCTASAACASSCRSGGAVSSCASYGTCKRYDVYCAYPVLTEAAVSDNNESGLGGALAYMYFGTAGAANNKSGTFASAIGGYTYNRLAAWASNFRGPGPVTGESDRTQWEWFDSAPGGLAVNYGTAGTPYVYGKTCVSVPVGGAVPALGTKNESVYEDDECFLGICNPDDYVGSFTIDRGRCASVFGRGATTGWTPVYEASVTSDVSRVRYKLWCYSCRNAPSGSCSAGVQ